MSYGDCEKVGVFYSDKTHDRVLLGEIINRLEFLTGLCVHTQSWYVWLGRARVKCGSFPEAADTACKMAERLGLTGSVSFSAPEMRKYLPGMIRMEFKSDYEVGQKITLEVPVAHSMLTNTTECIEAECEVREIESLGSKGWWIRMGYENGEFAAHEAMDGQLSIQTPVGEQAWDPKDDEFFYGIEGNDLYIAKHGTRR